MKEGPRRSSKKKGDPQIRGGGALDILLSVTGEGGQKCAENRRENGEGSGRKSCKRDPREVQVKKKSLDHHAVHYFSRDKQRRDRPDIKQSERRAATSADWVAEHVEESGPSWKSKKEGEKVPDDAMLRVGRGRPVWKRKIKRGLM